MRLSTLRVVIPVLTAGICLWLMSSAPPSLAADPPAGSFTAKVSIFVIPETDWQSELSHLQQQPGTLLQRLDELAGEGGEQPLHPSSEVICPLPDGMEHTFTSGGRLHTLPTAFEPPEEDPTKLKPVERYDITKTTGTEVKLRSLRTLPDGQTRHLHLALTHLYAEPASHAVVYGAAATTAEERQKLSVPLPILSEIKWNGEVTLAGNAPRLVACVLRHPGKGGDAKAQRCFIFIQSVPAQR